MEKKQQNGSHAAGTWISGASAPRSPCPWGVSPLQHCLGLGQFPGSVQLLRALSKAGSWSNGVPPLDLPEPLEMSQLRPEGRTGAGWAEGNVGRARQGRVCAVRAGETPGLASLGFMSWGQPGLCPSAMLLTPGASAPPSPSPQVRRLSARSVLVRGRCLQGPLGLGQTLRGPWGICV